MNKTILAVIAMAVGVLGMGGAAAGETVPNSLADAVVGEWALYIVPNGYTQRLTVVERDGDGPEAMVTVQIDTLYNNEAVSTAYYSDTAGKPETEPDVPGDGKSAQIRRETVAAAGGRLDVAVVSITSEDPEMDGTEWWVSAEVPVFGLVKRVEDGETTMELIEYGRN